MDRSGGLLLHSPTHTQNKNSPQQGLIHTPPTTNTTPKKQVAKELAKKTKGKGLAVLSGRALFEYDASLFVDDEEATDEKVDVSKVKNSLLVYR